MTDNQSPNKPDSDANRADQLAAMLQERDPGSYDIQEQKDPSPERSKGRSRAVGASFGLGAFIIGMIVSFMFGPPVIGWVTLLSNIAVGAIFAVILGVLAAFLTDRFWK